MEQISNKSQKDGIVAATRVTREITLNAANPSREWQSTKPIRFCADWKGCNPDPTLETEVRVLWSPDMLYVRFVCRYRELFVFEDSDSKGRRNHLWDRDVAEAFLQPDRAGTDAPESDHVGYKEFEVAPNGMWIDLDISPSGLADLKSGLTRSVHVDALKKIWTAELRIPMKAMTMSFDSTRSWRANFYRVEGKTESRQYLAWQPTHTPQPNFHVREAFGTLLFEQ